jgi:hypothetical protein
MKAAEALEIVNALANGYHPICGDRLPGGSLFDDAQVTRAMYKAAAALERYAKYEERTDRLPRNAGQTWSLEEEGRLASAFDEGRSIPALAAELNRSSGAIRARLMKLGKIEAGDWYSEQ